IINIPGDTNSQSSSVTKLKNNITNKNNEILNIVRSIRPNKVYDLVNSFLTDLNIFDNSYNDNNPLIKLLKEFPEKHTDAYSDKQSNQVFDIIELSSKISQSIKDSKQRASYIVEENDKSKKEIPVDYLPLRIGTDQDVPLIKDFILIFS